MNAVGTINSMSVGVKLRRLPSSSNTKHASGALVLQIVPYSFIWSNCNVSQKMQVHEGIARQPNSELDAA